MSQRAQEAPWPSPSGRNWFGYTCRWHKNAGARSFLMEWFIHNHDSIIKQWTLKALTVKPKASHTQHAPPGLSPAFTETLNIPKHQDTPAFSKSSSFFRDFFIFIFLNSPHPVMFFLVIFFFNHLNIFWYKKKKNKPTYDESTNHVCDLLLPPLLL